jgi:hypothetical protein
MKNDHGEKVKLGQKKYGSQDGPGVGRFVYPHIKPGAQEKFYSPQADKPKVPVRK